MSYLENFSDDYYYDHFVIDGFSDDLSSAVKSGIYFEEPERPAFSCMLHCCDDTRTRSG